MSSGKPAPSLGSACPDLLVRTYTGCDPDGCTLRAGEVGGAHRLKVKSLRAPNDHAFAS
jgi:hypothetical protein